MDKRLEGLKIISHLGGLGSIKRSVARAVTGYLISQQQKDSFINNKYHFKMMRVFLQSNLIS